MRNDVKLMCLYWTMAGIFPGEGSKISRFDFEDRVKAAAAAGFSGIGIWHADLEYITRTVSLHDMKAILDDYGQQHIELEFLTDWFVTGPRKASSDVHD